MSDQDPNVNKSPGQIELERRRLQFLKNYAMDITKSPQSVGKELGFSSKTAYEHVKWVCSVIATAQNRGEYPGKLLDYYNAPLWGTEEYGDPNAALTEDELNTLSNLVPQYGRDAMEAVALKQHGITPAGADIENEPQIASQPVYAESRHGANYNNQNNPSTNSYSTMSGNIFEGPNGAITEESILEGLLTNVGLASPGLRRQIMSAFVPMKQVFLTYPNKMQSFLGSYFAAPKAKAITEQYFDALPMNLPGFRGMGMQYGGMNNNPYGQQYFMQPGYGQQMQPGMMGMNPMMGGAGMGQMPVTGDPQFDAMLRQEMWKDYWEEKLEDKRAKRQERMMATGWQAQMSKMLEKSSNDSSLDKMMPFLMGRNGVVRQRMGEDGRPVYDYMMGGGGDMGGDSSPYKPILDVMSVMNANLLKNQTESPKLLESLVTTMFNRWNDNNNVFDAIKKITEIGGLMGNKPAETLDTVQAKLDTKLAMWHEEMRWREKQHEWQSGQEEQGRAERQQKEFVGTLRDLGRDVLGPVLDRFAKGYVDKQRMAQGMPPQGVPMSNYAQEQPGQEQIPQYPQPQPYYPPGYQPGMQPPPYPGYMQHQPHMHQPQYQEQQPPQQPGVESMAGPTQWLNLDDNQIDKMLSDIDVGKSRIENAETQLRREKSRRDVARQRIGFRTQTQRGMSGREEAISEEKEDYNFRPSNAKSDSEESGSQNQATTKENPSTPDAPTEEPMEFAMRSDSPDASA